MKKNLSPLTLLLLFTTIHAQDSILAPYQKFPTYPPAKLLLPDSTSFYTKDKLPKKTSVLLVLFDPHCEHCQQEADILSQNIEKFKEAHIVMASLAPIYQIKEFKEKYKLGGHKNIVFAQDTQYFLPTFYKLHNFPFHAFYDKKGRLISVFQGSMTLEKILTELKK